MPDHYEFQEKLRRVYNLSTHKVSAQYIHQQRNSIIRQESLEIHRHTYTQTVSDTLSM